MLAFQRASSAVLTSSPTSDGDDLVPPRPLRESPPTPSLTSSNTSFESHYPHPTPPDSARSRPSTLGVGAERPKSLPIDALFRSTPSGRQSPGPNGRPAFRSESPRSIEVQAPPRPSRTPMPSAFAYRQIVKKRSEDGLSIVSVSSYKRPESVRRARSSGFLLDGHQSYIVALCHRSRILTTLLGCMDFPDFHSLCCTSKAMRSLLSEQGARDVILSRFLPGYRSGVQPYRQSEIRVDLRDLETLMLCRAIPLRIYVQQAQDLISGLPNTESTGRLQHFANVYSRFALLLRQRAPQSSYISDVDDPHYRFGGQQDLSYLREIAFPPPLAFPETHAPKQSTLTRDPSRSKKSSRKNRYKTALGFLFGSSSTPTTPSYPPRSPPLHQTGGIAHAFPAFSDHLIKTAGSSPMSTLLRKANHRLSPPPPEHTPRAMLHHRRRTRMASISVSGRPSSADPRSQTRSPFEAAFEDDFNLFTPPQPAHLRTSSLPTSYYASTSASDSLNRINGGVSPSPQPQSPPPQQRHPHDISLAAARSRAPVCRVFVPCDKFTQSVLLACEGQLFTAGVWELLKPGDVICNLGYVPPLEANEWRQIIDSPSGWLVFNGQSLQPFHPPAAPKSVNPWDLPTPMYFCHLVPNFVNPRFYFNIPPSLHGLRAPELMLMPLTSSIQSPATRSGFTGVAKVKRFAWVGRVDGAELMASWRSQSGADASFDAIVQAAGSRNGSGTWSDAWNVEWIIEAEGTKEGRIALMMAIDPAVEFPEDTEWEVVREKCSPGRLWMRLVLAHLPGESTDELGHYRP